MKKILIVEADRPQARVARFEDQKMVEVEVEAGRGRSSVGNVYLGRVNRVLPGMEAAFIDIGLERDAFLFVDDAPAPDARASDSKAIADLVKAGQEIVVQITKEPLLKKGARVTARPSLAGKYLVLLPGVEQVAISRRLEDEDERARLESLARDLMPEDTGLIVRTQAEGRSARELRGDLEALLSRNRSMMELGDAARAPAVLHEELDLVERFVRDQFGEDIDTLWVDTESTRDRVLEIVEGRQAHLSSRVKLAEEGLKRFSIDDEIDAALESKVWLRSGGYLVVSPTEALVAIDVNTGRYVGKTTLRETILKTNLEAVAEIVRQIRLRDLGGILVIDLIDMEDEEDRRRVFSALEEEIAKDRSRSKLLDISELGLVQMTRKRSRSNLRGVMTRTCPHCRGSGVVRSIAAICADLHRETLKRSRRGRPLVVQAHPEVASALEGSERAVIEDLESRLDSRITVESDADLHHERFHVRPL